jgi:hypothetical protein
MTKSVKFLRDQWVTGYTCYSKGEVAGFPPPNLLIE